jgi:hypothetical protein
MAAVSPGTLGDTAGSARCARALLALVLALLGGCASFVRPDRARTLPAGEVEFLMATSMYAGERQDGNAANVDLVFRGGLSDRVELGGRVSLLYVGADVKVQLLRAPFPDCGVDIALAPSLGYGADITWDSGGAQVGLPLMIAINSAGYQLLLAPTLLYQEADVLPWGILNAGATVGFSKVNGGGFSLYPALAVWKALDPRRPIGSLSGPGPLMFQPTLVFRWGS